MIKYVKNKLFCVIYDRKGISALEYAILAASLLGVISAALVTFGADITSVFTTVGNGLKTDVGG